MAALEVERNRPIALGATRVRRYQPAPPMSAGFIVMIDPEGNELCQADAAQPDTPPGS